MSDFEEIYTFKEHDYEEKIKNQEQILKKILYTKNHVLIQFTQ